MTMFQVFDNYKPADTSPDGAGCAMSKNIGWDNSKFQTKEEAYEYAFNWLGDYAPQIGLVTATKFDIFARPYPYSAAGDTIQIKEV